MCFSPEASFTASAALLVTGLILVKRFPKEPKTLLALTPFFFAFQQFAEGMVWLAFKEVTWAKEHLDIFHKIYLFFAYLFWPIWIPFAFWFAEEIRWRKILIAISLLGGIYNFLSIIRAYFNNELASPQVVNLSIQYYEGTYTAQLFYVIVALFPFFISSIPGMKILGTLIAIAFIIASSLYFYAFVSVWCFFSAVIALGLIFILKKADHLEFKR